MVNWDNDKEQVFWIKNITAIISAFVLYFLMIEFPTLIVKTYFLFFFTMLLIACFLIAFVIPPIIIIIFNKLRNSDNPPLKTIFFYRTGAFILVFTVIFTVLFILNIG
ncbi:MAG: hypothetical protein GF329_12325 [Candidatus Lokiarchaeota archaeon]|nr:hypothetical protein [Candidatus Lokiarchaeota archaeon]